MFVDPRRLASLTLVLALVGGCEDDDGPTCTGALVTFRDPSGLVCVRRKLPTPECPNITLPPWPRCGNECEQIRDPITCAERTGCRIGWLDCTVFPDECDHPDGFIGCYQVTEAAITDAVCADVVGAHACAARDDCAGFYIKGPQCPGGDPTERQPNGEACLFSFARCIDELPPPPQ